MPYSLDHAYEAAMISGRYICTYRLRPSFRAKLT